MTRDEEILANMAGKYLIFTNSPRVYNDLSQLGSCAEAANSFDTKGK